ncbi:aldolase/citrate lyase family protein [Sphingomonas bacterium]|uniref:HpcH/HpaI aldolase family protein n=1 Tax=Sphingomonas bacterium TaxID=1895847 RepID=UPI002637D6B3|nr:aldolase/citrate lyase family protein [Sphingomonas bacterium]MDB5678289.1 HpcH/HpaI aldolase [Sphingomonas bacterium]
MTRYRSQEREQVRSIRDRLLASEPIIQLGIRNARTGEIIRMASAAGYDVIWIDLEHASLSIDCAAALAATAMDLGMGAWVRVPEREYGVIGRLLDCGASGIIVPKVETAAAARDAADACRFPPRGQRSALAMLPHHGFARMPATELTTRANDDVLLQVLIESRLGIENIADIAAVDGVDILGIGTNDLTADYGCPGEVRNPAILDACAKVAAAARAAGKLAVIGGVADAGHWRELLDMGFAPLVFAGIDTDMLAGVINQRADEWRAHMADA